MVAAILPPEILDQIFQLVLIPHYFVDPTPLPRSDSPWFRNLKQKKAFLLVCKTWHGAALRLLYQAITIHRIGPLIALSRVLDENRARLGGLIHSITLRCYVPHSYIRLLGKRMQVILDSCPSLTRLAYFPILSEQYRRWRMPVPSSLTHLTLRGLVRYENVLPILVEARETLTYLSILWCRTLCNAAISFPRLHTVVCSHDPIDDHRLTANFGADKDIDQDWSMPSLQAVTFEFSEGWSYERNPPPVLNLDMITRFCQRHGRTITSIVFQSIYAPAEPVTITNTFSLFNHVRVQDALDYCPSLKYMGVDWHSWMQDIRHSGLEYLDTWYRSLEHFPMNWNLPALKRVRLFENIILKTFPALIDTFPGSLPDDMGNSLCTCESYALNGSTMRVHTYNALVEWLDGKELICVHRPHTGDSDDEDQDDAEYIPSEEDSGSSDDDYSDICSDESLDIEDALERFTQSLQENSGVDLSDERD